MPIGGSGLVYQLFKVMTCTDAIWSESDILGSQPGVHECQNFGLRSDYSVLDSFGTNEALIKRTLKKVSSFDLELIVFLQSIFKRKH